LCRRVVRAARPWLGSVLTTLTDICGFALVLSFATAILPRLAA
jgi:hypothetical protein